MIFSQEPIRAAPAMPVGAYKTYTMSMPADLTVVAACSQVGCQAWRHGWETHVDEATPLGKAQASYIRRQCGRTFRERRTAAGITVFAFEPGQRCFAEHRTRPIRFSVRGGDWRADLGLIRAHSSGRDWAEDFGEHQDRLAGQIRKG